MRWLLGLAALAAVVLAVFGRVLWFDFVPLDDDMYAYGPLTRGWFEADWAARLFTPELGYATPVTTFVQAMGYQLFGPHPGLLHLPNLLLHVANAILVALLLRALDVTPLRALAVAALWALHPNMSEPVGWISQLKDIVTASGVLVAMLGLAGVLRGRRVGWAGVVLGTVLAIGAKPTGIVVGPLIVAFAAGWRATGKGRLHWGAVAWGLGALALSAALALSSYREHASFGGQEGLQEGEMVIAAAYQQLQNLLFPLGLSPRYLYDGADFTQWFAVIGASVLCVAGIWGARRAKPLVSWGLVWALVTWAPMSNLVPLNRFTTLSYAYLPTIGLAFVAAAFLPELGRSQRRALGGVATVALAFAALTSVQLQTWSGPVAFAEELVAHNPDDPFSRQKLAQVLFHYGRYEEAIEQFESIDPRFIGPLLPFPPRWAQSYCRLGDAERCDSIFARGVEVARHRQTSRAQHELDQTLAAWAHELNSAGRPVPTGLADDVAAALSATVSAIQQQGQQ